MKNKKDRFTHQPLGLELLEQRSLLSAYVYNTVEDFFNLTNPIHNVPMPDGVEISGFGASVASLGDIDGDGYDDFAASATIGGIGVGGSGVVFLFSGHTAAMIRSISDGAWDFGTSMVNLGDMNSDGVPDLFVGSPRYGADPVDNTGDPLGRAYIYSGMDGTILRTLEGTTANGEFGRVVARLANGDGDAIPDLVVGAPGSLPELAGQAFIFAGVDGSLLHTLSGAGAGDRFGSAIATGSGDGVDDADLFAIGAPFHDGTFQDAGRVYVFHTDSTLAYTLDGYGVGEEFGTALAIARTLGPLGVADASNRLFVGVPGVDTGGFDFQTVENRGGVASYDLAAGTDARAVWANDPTPNARFGSRLAVVRDMGGLGVETVLIGAPGSGRAYAVSASGETLDPSVDDVAPLASSVHGNAFAGLGDVNNDGIIDVISSDRNGTVTIVSSLALGRPFVITGTSSDLRYMWAEAGNGPVLFIDGVARSYSHVPGLSLASFANPAAPTSHILAIGNDGTIVFINQYRDGTPNTELLVDVNGTASTLQSLVVTVEGEAPPNYTNLNVVKVGSGGHILLVQVPLPPSPPYVTPTWVFSSGVLTRLWLGFVYDVNSTGSVVGQRHTDGVAPQAVLWSRASGTTIIADLEASSMLINDNGVVVGTRAGTSFYGGSYGTIATWLSGVTTNVVIAPAGSSSRPWNIRAIDNTGRILADAYTFHTRQAATYSTYLYEPGSGLRQIRAATHRINDSSFGGDFLEYVEGGPAALAAGGNILSNNAILTQVSDSAVGVLREGSPVLTISVPGRGNYAAAINQFDELVLFTLNGSSSTVRRLTEQLITAGNDNIAIFENTRFRRESGIPSAYVALANNGSLQIFTLVPGEFNDGRFLSVNQNDTAIVRDLTTFTNSDGIPHLVGFDAAGDLVINYWSAFSQDAGDWRFDNLSQNHLTPGGFATPTIVSHLTTYSTPWGGMNVAGIDTDGHVQVAWWAPGMMPWRLDDLSTAAGSTPVTFVGEITAYVSPWGTMHVNGNSETSGSPISLWWAPGDGTQWRAATLNPAGVDLDSDAFTSYVTPWGGLNVASLDETGHLAIYWWAPGADVWTPQVVEVEGAQSPVLTGRLGSNVEVTDETVTQSVVARGEDGSLYRFTWSIGDGFWTLENVTSQVG